MEFGWILLVLVGWVFAMAIVMVLLQMWPRDEDDTNSRR